MVALDYECEQIEKGWAVCIIGVDGGLGIATTGDMIESIGKFNVQWSTHGKRIAAIN